MFRTTVFLSLTTIAAINVTAGDDPIRLSYRPEAHTSAHYSIIGATKQTLAMAQRKIETHAVTDLKLNIEVKETVLSRSTMELLLSKATAKLSMSESVVPNNGAEEEISNVVGRSVSLTIAPDGSEISKTIDTAKGGSAQMEELLMSTKFIDRLFMPLSAADVAPGSKWKVPLSDTILTPQGMGKIVTSGTLEVSYKGIVDTMNTECWMIESVSDDLVQTGEYHAGATHMALRGKGTFRGTSYLNAKTGMMVTSQYVTSTKADMELGLEQKVSMPVLYEVTLSINENKEGSR